jgi:hypothetical protein
VAKVCNKCGNEFPITIVIDGKKRNLCNRKYCLDCLPFGFHKELLKKRKPGQIFVAKCKHHGETDFVIEINGNRRCKRCRVESVTKRRRKVKEKLVEYFGGKCKLCDYSKCQQALEFHHLDPDQKKFTLGEKGACRKWEEMLAEAKKCVLLCSRCHKEVEYGVTKLEES